MSIIECVLVMCAVVFYLSFGCWVGREYGSYKKLLLNIIDKLKERQDE